MVIGLRKFAQLLNGLVFKMFVFKNLDHGLISVANSKVVVLRYGSYVLLWTKLFSAHKTTVDTTVKTGTFALSKCDKIL